jgi:hypothetical protein
VLVALLDSPAMVRPLPAEWGGRPRALGLPRDASAPAGKAWQAMLALALPPGSGAMQGAWANFYAEVVAGLEALVGAPGPTAPGTIKVRS